uniref:No apical meristem-associated C-terminal domain-containing protein n=1 Tax=Setaria viridis TaxID=4556 RepID=A0A4U6U350_SETVI|nr:hypothetical protein SEVIR_6G134600v2 [Setaria viridis]
MDPLDRSFSRLLGSDPTNPRPKNTSFQQQAQFVHSGGIFGSPVGASSHGYDSETPQSQRREVEQAEEVKYSSGSSPDEGRRGVRINYTEEENLRLASAWLKHSVDPVNGNDKTGEYYWRSVAEEFNSNKHVGGRTRSKGQLKSHWGKVSAAVAKFNRVHGRMDFCSGESNDMIMDKAHIMFKRENKQRPFIVEYVRTVLKDQPKWKRSVMGREDKNKRTKVDGFGAYTSSSNQDMDDGERHKEKHPEGQKKAKARMRGKGKEKVIPQSPLGIQLDDDMVLFHDAMAKREEALAKIAEAAAAKARFDQMSKYLEYADKDTSNYSAARLKMHSQILAELSKDLYPPSDD